MADEKNITPPREHRFIQEAISVCPYCQRRFPNMDQLTLHVVTRHTRTGRPKQSVPAGTGSTGKE